MAKTLYVGNLPWSTKEEDLRTAFEPHATVLSTRIVTERETGRSRGFGFVEIEDNDVAKAIEAMNGFQLGGRALVVNEARPKSA